MRKLVALTFISLDGVMQAPGGPKEDTSNGFAFGGWTVPYADEVMGEVMGKQMGVPFDLLLGRKTYDIFAGYWPRQDERTSPPAAPLNRAKKYVASHSPKELSWQNSTVITGDIPAEVQKLKEGDGPMLQVHGSGELLQTLLEHDLLDELWLKIFPVTLGSGKRLFGEGTVPAAFTLLETVISPKGVIAANYKREGTVQTGSFAD
jgi:dihydrofolate reductase